MDSVHFLGRSGEDDLLCNYHELSYLASGTSLQLAWEFGMYTVHAKKHVNNLG